MLRSVPLVAKLSGKAIENVVARMAIAMRI
jgi:hypothetical protein